jgi:hypothetical protein
MEGDDVKRIDIYDPTVCDMKGQWTASPHIYCLKPIQQSYVANGRWYVVIENKAMSVDLRNFTTESKWAAIDNKHPYLIPDINGEPRFVPHSFLAKGINEVGSSRIRPILSTRFYCYGRVRVGPYLHFIGGSTNRLAISSLDLRNDEWVTVLPPLPIQRVGGSACVYRSMIVLAGGYGWSKIPGGGRLVHTSSVISLGLDSKSWVEMAPLPRACNVHLMVVNNDLYALATHPRLTKEMAETSRNRTTSDSKQLDIIPLHRINPPGIVMRRHNDRMGEPNGLYQYDESSGWITLQSLPVGRTMFACCVID